MRRLAAPGYSCEKKLYKREAWERRQRHGIVTPIPKKQRAHQAADEQRTTDADTYSAKGQEHPAANN